MTYVVTAQEHGVVKHGTPEVAILFYGPKGGSRGGHYLAPQEARDLAAALIKAADDQEDRA